MAFPDPPRRYVKEVPEPNFEPLPKIPIPEPKSVPVEIPIPVEKPVEVPVPA
jgi:hypothetical protein